MDLNQIRSFLAVTQTLNFTNAARQNGIPQSTISRHISDLEEQLGIKLFYRTRRSVQLTDEGRIFLPYAQEIVEAAQKGTKAVRQLHDGGKGRLTIATIAISGAVLSDCLREFGQRYPNVVVDITQVSSGDAMQDEGNDPFDFHFIHSDMLPESEEYDSLITHADDLCLVVPKGHRLIGQEWSAMDLKDEKFILVSESESPILYMLVQNYFRACRLSPTVVNESDNVYTVLFSVSAGLGISILPSSHPREFMLDSLDVLPLPEMDASISYAVTWKKSLLNPAAHLFLEIVRKYFPSE